MSDENSILQIERIWSTTRVAVHALYFNGIFAAFESTQFRTRGAVETVIDKTVRGKAKLAGQHPSINSGDFAQVRPLSALDSMRAVTGPVPRRLDPVGCFVSRLGAKISETERPSGCLSSVSPSSRNSGLRRAS